MAHGQVKELLVWVHFIVKCRRQDGETENHQDDPRSVQAQDHMLSIIQHQKDTTGARGQGPGIAWRRRETLVGGDESEGNLSLAGERVHVLL